MSKVIEETIKALTEFEAHLDVAMTEATEARKKLVKNAAELGDASRSKAVDAARKIASEKIEEARAEAEREAAEIKRKGQASLKKHEESMSKHKAEAVALVEKHLLGEEK